MNQKISVIVPVYNLEKYVSQSIETVLSQTYPNLEIIVINDGSTDHSLSLIQELASRDDRMIVIDQPNGGLSAARNAGLDRASGDFIYFLDGDDLIHPQLFEILLAEIERHGTDIVYFLSEDIFEYPDKMTTKNKANLVSLEELTLEEVLNQLPNQGIIRFEVWNKLYNRDVIGDVRFVPGQVYEDVYFNRETLLKENISFGVMKEVFHYYLKERTGNTNSSSFKSNRFLVYKEWEKWFEVLDKKGMTAQNDRLKIAFLIFLFGQYALAKNRKASREILDTIQAEYCKIYSPQLVKNASISKLKKIFLRGSNTNMDMFYLLYQKIRRQ